MAYDNTNRGALFVNKDKKDESHADSSGKIDIEGVEYYVDAWLVKQDGKDQQDIRVKKKGSSRLNGDGDGTMHRTDKEGQSEKHPDWKGSLKMENGKVYELAGWKRHSPKNDTWFLSLSVKKKEDRQSTPAKQEPEVDQEQEDFPF